MAQTETYRKRHLLKKRNTFIKKYKRETDVYMYVTYLFIWLNDFLLSHKKVMVHNITYLFI